MGNDNSHSKEDPQQKPTTSPSHANTQPPSEEVQEEFLPSLEASPVLFPQWDPKSYQGGQREGEEQKEEKTFPSLFSENPNATATNSRSGDVTAQRSAWEEGQLLPALPQTDLYIEGLEYKESGQSAQPGTISNLTSEEDSGDEEYSAAEDIGLIGILREWGQHVLPENISKIQEEEKSILPEMPQADPSSKAMSVITSGFNVQASEDLLGMQDTEPEFGISSITNFKSNDAAIQSDCNLGNPSVLPLTSTPQLIPAAKELFSKNATLSQPAGMLQEPDDICNQTKEVCKDSNTDQVEQKGSYNSRTLTTDHGNSQTWGQSHLILPVTTDGSSDNHKDKLPIPHSLEKESCLHIGESSKAESLEPNLVVSELNNLVTSLFNQQSLLEVTGPESLHAQMGKITAYHNSPVDVPDRLKAEKKECLDTERHVKETTSAENIQPTNANTEISEEYGLQKKSTRDDEKFTTKDMINRNVQKKGLKNRPKTKNAPVHMTKGLNEDVNHLTVETTASLVDTSLDLAQMTASSDLIQVVNQTSAETGKDITFLGSVNNLLLEDVSTFCLNTTELHLAAPNPDIKEDIANGLPICSKHQSLTSPSIGEDGLTSIRHTEVTSQQNIDLSPLGLTGNEFTTLQLGMDIEKVTTGETGDVNDLQRSTQEDVGADGQSSLTPKQKALKTDAKNSYLPISACPVITGHSPDTQVLPTLSPLDPIFFIHSRDNKRDYKDGSHPKEENSLIENSETFSVQTKVNTSQNQSEKNMCLNTMHQNQIPDTNAKLQSSDLSDVENLNRKPDCTIGESSKVQLKQNISASTPEEFKIVDLSPNLESRSTKEKEDLLITLSQQEIAFLENTPYLDKVLCHGKVLEEKAHESLSLTSELSEYISDSTAMGDVTDKTISTTCKDTGTEDTLGLQEDNILLYSQPDEGLIPEEKQSLKLLTKGQCHEDENANEGIPTTQAQLEVSPDACTQLHMIDDKSSQLETAGVRYSSMEIPTDCSTNIPNIEIDVGNMGDVAVDTSSQDLHKTENTTNLSRVSLQCKHSQIFSAPDKNFVSEHDNLSVPLHPSDSREDGSPLPAICPEAETQVCDDLTIKTKKNDINESIFNKDLSAKALENTDEVQKASIKPLNDTIEAVFNKCNMETAQTFTDQRSYHEDIESTEHVATCSYTLAEEPQPPEQSYLPSIRVNEKGSMSYLTCGAEPRTKSQSVIEEANEKNVKNDIEELTQVTKLHHSVIDNHKDILHSITTDGPGEIFSEKAPLDTTQPSMSIHKLMECTNAHTVSTEKSEEISHNLHHNIHKEVHPQEKHPEMAFEVVLNFCPEGGEEMIHSSQEHSDAVKESRGTEMLLEQNEADIIHTDSVNATSKAQVGCMKNSESAPQQHAPSGEETEYPSTEPSQISFEITTAEPEIVNPCEETGVPILSTSGTSDGHEIIPVPTQFLPKGKSKNCEHAMEPQMVNNELISDHLNLLPEEEENKVSQAAMEKFDSTASKVDVVPEITDTLVSDSLTVKKSDILPDMSGFSVKETAILSDEPYLLSEQAHSVSTAISPPSDDLTTLLEPESSEETHVAQDTVHIELVNEKCGLCPTETVILQKKEQTDQVVFPTNQEKASTVSGPPGIDHTEDKIHFPSNTAIGSDLSNFGGISTSVAQQKSPSFPCEPEHSSPVIRSPTFPTSDSYSFTQKLRSVLHSDRPVTKKSVKPSPPVPLMLPSSPTMPQGGMNNERSSDSEEAFETPESTTPVKSVPPIPIPVLPEVQEQQPQQRQEEETPYLPPKPEEPDLAPNLGGTEASDVTAPENFTDSPFRQPSRSFSVVFDEDKPIASSGTYNLELAAVESPEVSPSSSKDPNKTRRKSTDSVPLNRNTLSRSLSLQAADFQLEDLPNSQGGSGSACSTLRRTKKARPASLKKKAGSTKKQEAVTINDSKDTSKELSGESQEVEVDRDLQVELAPFPPHEPSETDAELPVGVKEESSPPQASDLSQTDSQFSELTSSPAQINQTQATGRLSPPIPTHQKFEVAPSGPEISENIAVIGQSVRLEFDYSEESHEGQPPSRKGKKPAGKMPLRKPKPKKTVEKPDAPPGAPSPIPNDPEDMPIGKGSYTYNMDQWDDPNFNPFSSSGKTHDSPLSAQETLPELPNPTVERSESPAKTPASFEISAEQNGESIKPSKKKKTPLKTDTFRVKKSPKRSPVTENGSEELTILCKSDTPPVIASEEHATDEEKLASSVSSQKWSCMAVDLEQEKPDYPQPSDLTSFVSESQFHSSPSGMYDIDYGSSFSIEYMEKTGKCSPIRDMPQTQSMYLMFEASVDSQGKTPAKFSDSCTLDTESNFEEMDPKLCSVQLPISRSPPIMQDNIRQPVERSRQREDEPEVLGSGKMELGSPEDDYVASEALLSRISHHTALCGQLSYLEPDLAEKNPQAFAQKLQEELEFAAMRIEALTLARHISQSSQCTESDVLDSADIGLSHKSLYPRSVAMETAVGGLLHTYKQPDLDTALQLAREEIAAKEQETMEWKTKYEESRCEVVEMRKIVAEYEQTIAQMIEDDQREKSVSHHTVQQLILEKEQALSDLNSVEKSLADLFRRYEKMKDVLEGFRKNEEVLKKCAQEYLARVKKEEQRYHALKIHAEEKLDRANSDIAQVRSKSQQEHAAYQASLRKEQLRVDALERTLEQKNKEIEELTKICDELISKMGKS
ncbi:transforming acidic coiled-coil-containing protein 2 isoform X1 [Bufo gargarizans]|uniref:transforming acidic coiled-coil-containing protein 2 isoform X1 n=1 Tax=Bufo gargarizans TaxID=30331 RepID=UPI001CF255CF|nr:transforming acidic coiled-coil-containing protein 2 isoform X1 [Bufo gargarizans]XP_044152866.1 transforming acidic coiled-coil-containing protein 2 isoform X1 [Bufo gargarizans]